MPTPTAQNVHGSTENNRGERLLPGVVADLFPTPAAKLGDPRRGSPSAAVAQDRMDSGRRNLDDAVALLPTPTGADGAGGPGTSGRAGGPNLRTEAALLPTPLARDGQGRGEGHPDRHGTKGPHLGEVARHHLMPTPRATDGEKGGPNQRGSSGDLMLPSAVQPERWGRYTRAITRWEHTLGRPAPDPTEPGTRGQPRLSPAFSEWLMGLPAGHLTDHLGRNAALKAAGNGVVPQQVAHAVAVLLADVITALEGKAAA